MSATEGEEEARRYFDLQVERWPNAPTPDVTKPLYLDGLAISYLQTVRLFDAVLKIFPHVLTDAETQSHAESVVDQEGDTEEVLKVIELIRDSLATGRETAKVTIGKQRDQRDSERRFDQASSLNLLADLSGIDAAIFDDRALNKESAAIDASGTRVRLATTLDVLDDLVARSAITEAKRLDYRRRLRLAGVALIPLDEVEVVAAVRRNRAAESPEFRAIAESIDLARIAEVPRFPSEIPWFGATGIAIKNALIALWDDQDRERAAALSDQLLELMIKPWDWAFAWKAEIAPNWAEDVWRVTLAGLAIPVQLAGKGDVHAFNIWAERRIWKPMRSHNPERYAAIVEHLKRFVSTTAMEDADEN